nr:hypothetical protein GCM10020093_000490 [Planobispora longispora]
MKKLINGADAVVTDALRGLAAAHPGLRVDAGNRIVVRAGARAPARSGWSPAGLRARAAARRFRRVRHARRGLSREIFTSPVPDQVVEASTAVHGGAGVLHVVKNYTGDVLNFRMAAELCAEEGVEVASVLVDDDVAVRDSLYTAAAGAPAPRSSWRRSPEPWPRPARRWPRWRGSPGRSTTAAAPSASR